MLQLVYNMAMLVVNGKADMQSFAANLVRQIMIIGIFAFFLNNGPDLFNVIIKSFRMAAAGSGKLPPDVSPGGIYSIGLKLTEKLKDVAWENTGFFSGSIGYLGYLYIALVCFVMFLSFSVITAVYTLTLIKTYFICTAGMLFLGFGGSEWSNDIAKSTLKCVFSVGAEVFVILLIAAIANTAISGWIDQITPTMTGDEYSSMAGVMASMTFILAILSVTAPGLASGLISGSAIGAGGTALAGGMAAGAAVATAARGGRGIAGGVAGGYKARGQGGKAMAKGAIIGALKSMITNKVSP